MAFPTIGTVPSSWTRRSIFHRISGLGDQAFRCSIRFGRALFNTLLDLVLIGENLRRLRGDHGPVAVLLSY